MLYDILKPTSDIGLVDVREQLFVWAALEVAIGLPEVYVDVDFASDSDYILSHAFIRGESPYTYFHNQPKANLFRSI